MGHDAGPEPGELAGGALEDVDVVAEVAEQEGGGQPAHRSSHDGYAHRLRIKDEG
jgi:hypothetical protein